MTKSVAIYTRVSKDNFGDERSPIRQEADCRAFAAIRDWEVVAAYRDVDLSAYVPRVRRTGYEALLEAIADRAIDGVLVWKLDRLSMSPSTRPTSWVSPSCASWSPSQRWSRAPRACACRPRTVPRHWRASDLTRINVPTA